MTITIEEISALEDEAICTIIQSVGAEFGAIGEGFGPSDREVLAMSQHYPLVNRSRYFIAKVDGEVVGGVGIAPFGQENGCELKKLFLKPQYRGLGIGRSLTQTALDFAKQQGFAFCYLDTLANMGAAISLYEKLGFVHLSAPLESIHGGCDVWMVKHFAHSLK